MSSGVMGVVSRGGAAPRQITPIILHGCQRLYTKIEVNIWAIIMSGFIKKLVKIKLQSQHWNSNVTCLFFYFIGDVTTNYYNMTIGGRVHGRLRQFNIKLRFY